MALGCYLLSRKEAVMKLANHGASPAYFAPTGVPSKTVFKMVLLPALIADYYGARDCFKGLPMS
jgi:hypothetical protein